LAPFAGNLLMRAPDDPVLMKGGTLLSRLALLASASALAAALPDRPAALNLCEDREGFLTAFLALLMRGQTCLLPPARAPAAIDEVLQEHPGSYRIDDVWLSANRRSSEAGARADLAIPPERIVVVGYTSGSTGRPVPNPKTWHCLSAAALFNAARMREVVGHAPAQGVPWILATVPSQHMYGLEMSVLQPLLGGMAVHAAHPLYPADIAAALAEMASPRVLVTTPFHLRALMQSGVELPALAAIVSATAPLAAEQARAAEQRFATRVLEFFGSTETCVIASRLTASESAWTPYPGLVLEQREDTTRVAAPWLPAGVVLQDVLDLRGDGRFEVRGRNSDMVEVAGKRASLADLTRRLLSVPGVTDAVFFQPDAANDAGVRRLAALAVASGLDARQVLAQLASLVDPVFLPRPLVLLRRLPRNEVGKLPREALLAALQR
jgi:acyl-coenzyme A synthetase/AMP-(fatty) acid ligase